MDQEKLNYMQPKSQYPPNKIYFRYTQTFKKMIKIKKIPTDNTLVLNYIKIKIQNGCKR